MPEDMLSQDIEAYDAKADNHETVGGKRHRKRSKSTRTRKNHHKKRKGKGKGKGKGTKKQGNKKGPSKWIMHVKAFCRKTGKTFPEALKDPMCKNSFKH